MAMYDIKTWSHEQWWSLETGLAIFDIKMLAVDLSMCHVYRTYACSYMESWKVFTLLYMMSNSDHLKMFCIPNRESRTEFLGIELVPPYISIYLAFYNSTLYC